MQDCILAALPEGKNYFDEDPEEEDEAGAADEQIKYMKTHAEVSAKNAQGARAKRARRMRVHPRRKRASFGGPSEASTKNAR